MFKDTHFYCDEQIKRVFFEFFVIFDCNGEGICCNMLQHTERT